MDAVAGMFLVFSLVYFAIADGVGAFRLTAKNFKNKADLTDSI